MSTYYKTIITDFILVVLTILKEDLSNISLGIPKQPET